MPPEHDPSGANAPETPGKAGAGFSLLFMLVIMGVFLSGGLLFFFSMGVSWLIQNRTGEGLAALSIPAFFIAFVVIAVARKRRPALADVVGPEPERTVDPVASPAGVNTTALPAGASLGSYRISLPEPDVLAMVPTPGQYAGATAFIGFGTVPAVLGLGGLGLGMMAWPEAAGSVIFGLLFSAAGFAALGGLRSHRFDRRAGVYRICARKRTDVEIPLRSIRGVQLVTDVPREEEGRSMTHQVAAHQLNLILDAGEERRRNLVEGRDREAILELGRLLAGFLGLPLYRDRSP